jgi:hypothetical protein
MVNLYEFLQSNLSESVISNKDFSRAQDIIKSYFQKYKIYTMPDLNALKVDNIKYYGNLVFNADTNNCAYFLWKQSGSTELDGIVLCSNATIVIDAIQNGKTFTGDVSITLTGVSLAKVLPVVKDAILGDIRMKEADIKELLGDALVESAEEGETTLCEDANLVELEKRKDKVYYRLYNLKRKGLDYSAEEREYEEIKQSIKDAKMGVRSNPKVTVTPDPEVEEVQNEFEERATPEERFNDMEHYVDMVLKGLQPSLLICGAPGVGKTYRVMKKVKEHHTMGDNLYLIKAKCTPQSFFMTLFDYRHEGDIIVIDDADSLLEDDTAINLIKAATDSSDERWVSYGTSRPPIMPEDRYESLSPEDQAYCETVEMRGAPVHFYPKSFVFEGSLIIITNRNAGSVDTAVKNRAILCDLEFTTEELLGIVKSLMPAIGEGKLDTAAKIKAMTYLEEMAKGGANIEISIRSFITVSKLYMACGNDNDSAQRMIREQMRLQYSRNKKHY